MATHSFHIPEYLVEGIAAFKAVRTAAKTNTSSFDELYAKGAMPLVVAQSHMSLKDHGLGMLEDENGILWSVEDGVIYRLADE